MASRRYAASWLALTTALLVAGCGEDGTKAESASAVVPTGGPVQKGTIHRWPEATTHLSFDLEAAPPSSTFGPPRPSGLDAFWSVASTKGAGAAFFYADTFRAAPETRIAYASVGRVATIRDATKLDYTSDVVGPVSPGHVLVLHHVPSDRYVAFVLDAVVPADPRDAGAGPYAYADVTWYLAAKGSADFSAAP